MKYRSISSDAGDLIQGAMDARGLTLNQLAGQLTAAGHDVSRARAKHWLRGVGVPDTIKPDLCRILGIQITDLVVSASRRTMEPIGTPGGER